jgi:hypothetical protein
MKKTIKYKRRITSGRIKRRNSMNGELKMRREQQENENQRLKGN